MYKEECIQKMEKSKKHYEKIKLVKNIEQVSYTPALFRKVGISIVTLLWR